MARWYDFPREIRHQILAELCSSLASEFSTYEPEHRTDPIFGTSPLYPYPLPLTNYLNALLTCRDFYESITKEIKLCDGSTSRTLQLAQYERVTKYSYDICVEFPSDYTEILRAKSNFGCFWKNPLICERYEIFDEIFRCLKDTGRIMFVCLLGDALEKCKEPRDPSSRKFIKAQKAEVDGSFHGLVFSKGSFSVQARCTYFDTVSSCQYAKFKYHNLEKPLGVYSSDGKYDFVRVPHDREPMRNLPDISASESDTWWLGRVTGEGDEWKQWYLVNYKEKQIFVGPAGTKAEWPDSFHSDSNLHVWSHEFLEECFNFEDSP